MSEIFDWMRRNEVGRGRDFSNLAKSDEIYTLGSEISPEGTGRESPPVAELTLAKGRGIGTFELDNASPGIKSVLNPLTLVGERYRILRSKLSLMQHQRGIKTLMITSSIPDEGKTFTACSLAAVLSQEPEKQAILVDADLRKPKTGFNFGLPDYGRFGGLSEVLKGKLQVEDSLLGFRNTNLYLLPSGEIPPNPAELLSSPNLEQAINKLKELADWIVVDSPPYLTLADASLIARYCDAVLLIVHAGRTPSRLILDCVERIGRERICGVILNRVPKIEANRYYYGHYYSKSDAAEGKK
jgi:capsular exopolysaccharide synthesis family protein